MDEGFRRLVNLVGDALERPPEERAAYVEEACGEDEELLAEARSLLAQAEATSFDAVTERLEAGIGRVAGSVLRESGPRLPDAGHGEGETRPGAEAHSLPDRIGPFRILGLLGEGGMGVVYRAEQEEPIRREVALKVIRGGLRSPSARARFEAERQALAVMDHPAIAGIYDAGATEDGAPWFAMELVRGEPIVEYCDERGLDLDQRMDLFGEICRGVHHAHAKGVVHRDLKPSNILVATVDGRPRPRIIDFGIAKVVEASSASEAPATAVGSVMGTLEYMSPEQAEGGRAPVDIRSDVYALGVVLYELVAGGLPFESDTLRDVGPLEAQRLIRDTDPPSPVERFRTTPDPDAVARARRTEARTLRRRLDGDLGWIVMRALEKDPERRYSSAAALAEDLGRLRRHEPVEAGPPSRRYHLARFVRRHRVAVAATGAVLVALVAGTLLATVGLVRATRAQDRAESEARRATLISDFLAEMLASARPEEARGRVITVREVVDSTAARLDRENTFGDDPEVRAAVLHALGVTYRSLGLYREATPLFQEALDLRRTALGSDDTLTLNSLSMLTANRAQGGDPEGAIPGGLELVEARERVQGRSHPEYVTALSNLANMHADVGDFAAAEETLREALEIERRIVSEGSGEEGRAGDLAITLNNLATVLVDEEKFEEALPFHEESLEIRRRVFGEPSAEMAIALGNLSAALHGAGREARAEAVARRALGMSESVFGPTHPRTATARMFLADVLVDAGRAAEAVPLARRAVADFSVTGERYWRTGAARALLGRALLAVDRGAGGGPEAAGAPEGDRLPEGESGLEGRSDLEGARELEAGWEILTETLSADSPRTRSIAAALADHWESRDEPALAAEWRARAGPE